MVKSAAGISDDDPIKEAMEKLRMCCEDERPLTAGSPPVLEAAETDRGQRRLGRARPADQPRMSAARARFRGHSLGGPPSMIWLPPPGCGSRRS
jgi:hypothetical protein